MEFNPGFFDKDGLLRTRRITEYGVSETKDAFNGLIHSSYLKTLLLKNNWKAYSSFFRSSIANAYRQGDKNISHDDMTGVVCATIFPEDIKWSRYWYRTEAFLYLYCAGHKWAKLFFPILWLKMIGTCAIKEKAKNGLPETDGPLQAWLICENFSFKRVGKICEFFNKINFGKKCLSNMFQIRFHGNEFTDNADHPCRVVSRLIDGV